MTIKQFLTKHVEGYLFKDLQTLSRVKLKKGQKIGGVGYPMVISILAGMELLGGLLQESAFINSGSASKYFDNYWNNFFSRQLPKYKPYSLVFRKLVRNGIAHTYLTKTGIWIVKGNPNNHLKTIKHQNNYYLIVDINELHDDFLLTYKSAVRPIIWGEIPYYGITKTILQDRLNEMINIYEEESNEELSKIPSLNTPHSIHSVFSNASTVVSSGMPFTYSGTVFKKN